jgi:ADP-heptose:LPS heptosyltransferase
MKLLIVKRDKVGDLLLATPMLRVLREAMPAARIDLLASDYNAWVVEGSRDLDRIWTYRRTREGRRVWPRAALSQAALWMRPRAERYDVAIAANGESSPLYPGDDAAAQAVLDAGHAHIHPFRGPLRLGAALAWLARTSIFPDSGLMHLAAASPGGVLGLFAETGVSPHPSHGGPLGENADYLDAGKSVAELDDAAVLARVERLVQRR